MRRYSVLLAILLSFPPFSYGQALSGISAVSLAVDLSREADARACGVSVASVDAAMRIPLSNSSLSVVKIGAAVLSAGVNVLQAPNGQCAAAITVALDRPVSLQPAAGSPRVGGQVWSNSHLLIGFPQGFGKATSDKVEDFTKQFIAAWLKDR